MLSNRCTTLAWTRRRRGSGGRWPLSTCAGWTYAPHYRGVESLSAGIFVCPLLTDALALRRAAWTSSEGEEVPDPNYSPTILTQLFIREGFAECLWSGCLTGRHLGGGNHYGAEVHAPPDLYRGRQFVRPLLYRGRIRRVPLRRERERRNQQIFFRQVDFVKTAKKKRKKIIAVSMINIPFFSPSEKEKKKCDYLLSLLLCLTNCAHAVKANPPNKQLFINNSCPCSKSTLHINPPNNQLCINNLNPFL